jgi:YVTN family beta-propeller protein
VSYVAGTALATGTTVAGYRIEALIGRGGMGAVYRASEEGLGRKVALKVIAPELAQDERFRERFLRESRIAASLDHPHVIPIYQAGDEDGLLFLAMRYVEGYDLAKLVAEEGALEPRRALDLLSQVAEALDAAHEKGLVHRDVKPSNVLIAEAAGREHCYLGDFGLTKRTGSLSGVSVAGEIVGTLEYVAPEQITGDPLDERSDVYSLGCVLYECLTGQSPFPRATDVALLWAHVHEEPTPPSKARSELPKELDTVLARALAKEPGRRYRSAGELVAATRSALRLGDLPAPAAARSRTRIAAAAAVVLVVFAAFAAFLLTRGSNGITTVSPNHVGVIDPASNEVVAEVQVGRKPLAVATGGGSAWVTNTDEEIVSRIDALNLDETARNIPVPGYPSDVLWGASSAWVALGPSGRLITVNPDQNRPSQEHSALGKDRTCSSGPNASLAIGTRAVWFLCRGGEFGRFDLMTYTGLDVATDVEIIGTSDANISFFEDVTFGRGSLWVVDSAKNSIYEIDPQLRRFKQAHRVGADPRAVAVAEDSVWVANFGDGTVTRLVFSPQVSTPDDVEIEVGDGPVDVAVGEDAIWVVNQLSRTVSRIDPETNEVVATIPIGNEPQRIAAGEGYVWVTVRAPEADVVDES